MEIRRNTDLTQERLKALLSYDPTTGIFRWVAQPGGSKKPLVGKVAGVILRSGHRQITVDGKQYYASALAWLYVHGSFPERMLDHKDVDAGNDRIDNLRQSTRQGNSANRRAYRCNTSGAKGVQFRSERKLPWSARICVNYQHIHLGSFLTKEEAAAAYARASTTAFGEFARAA